MTAPHDVSKAVAASMALQEFDRLKAMTCPVILPDEAAMLERMKRRADEFRLVVRVTAAFLEEVAL